MKRFAWTVLLAVVIPSVSIGRLPPPSEEAKAKAAEAAAKAAETAKLDAYQLCESQDRVVQYYAKTNPAAKVDGAKIGKCESPAKVAAAAAESAKRPIEAAGAHSPTATAATSPVATKASASQATPAKAAPKK